MYAAHSTPGPLGDARRTYVKAMNDAYDDRPGGSTHDARLAFVAELLKQRRIEQADASVPRMSWEDMFHGTME